MEGGGWGVWGCGGAKNGKNEEREWESEGFALLNGELVFFLVCSFFINKKTSGCQSVAPRGQSSGTKSRWSVK